MDNIGPLGVKVKFVQQLLVQSYTGHTIRHPNPSSGLEYGACGQTACCGDREQRVPVPVY